mmetsp:Transcript_56765/g.179459  ORF Transcript_56765/g.179459 Transcript_56765/m.179459 type:complete len:389 (+) Transcript_56765:81-1247(+)
MQVKRTTEDDVVEPLTKPFRRLKHSHGDSGPQPSGVGSGGREESGNSSNTGDTEEGGEHLPPAGTHGEAGKAEGTSPRGEPYGALGGGGPSAGFEGKLFVHMDLKGAPPVPSFLIACLECFAQWGADGVVMEWEDMLPFEGALAGVCNEHHYSPAEVEGILAAAARLDLDVIPLVQSFGHLEFVLKHDEFAAYREDADEWLCLCPLVPGSSELAKELVRQTMALHPGCSHIHIGCDEVFDLGSCPRCESKMCTHGREALFFDFVEGVLDECLSLGVKSLLWHDMFVGASAHVMQEVLASRGAEPVVWNYGDLSSISDGTMADLSEAFPGRVWGASAYKGASEPDAVWVPLARHIQNHIMWLDRHQQTCGERAHTLNPYRINRIPYTVT